MKVKDYVEIMKNGMANIDLWFTSTDEKTIYDTTAMNFNDSHMGNEEIDKIIVDFTGESNDIYIKKTKEEYKQLSELAVVRDALDELDMGLVKHTDGMYSVCRHKIANPLFYFDISQRGEKYTGTVDFKIYNVGCYTGNQIKSSLQIVNNFMNGDM